MQLQDDHLYRAILALEYYRDNMTGHDYIWDRYDSTVRALKAYQENYTPDV